MNILTPLDYHFSPSAMSCQLALLEMSCSTVINLLAHLLERSIKEGDGVIRKETMGRLSVCLLFHEVPINIQCNINKETAA